MKLVAVPKPSARDIAWAGELADEALKCVTDYNFASLWKSMSAQHRAHVRRILKNRLAKRLARWTERP